MKDKYYTPEIEEFRVGFEYERLRLSGDWDKFSFSNLETPVNPLSNIRYLINKDRIRVKYLDRDDIESLGFYTEDNGECYNLEKRFDSYGLYPWENNKIHITKEMETLFKGIIKNKSELKKLLKKLNIL